MPRLKKRRLESFERQHALSYNNELPKSQIRSAEHLDHDVYTAGNAELCKDLLLLFRKINMKFNTTKNSIQRKKVG